MKRSSGGGKVFGKTVFRTNLILPWVVLDSSPASYLESHLPQKSAPLCGNTELKEARGTIIGPSGAITSVADGWLSVVKLIMMSISFHHQVWGLLSQSVVNRRCSCVTAIKDRTMTILTNTITTGPSMSSMRGDQRHNHHDRRDEYPQVSL